MNAEAVVTAAGPGLFFFEADGRQSGPQEAAAIRICIGIDIRHHLFPEREMNPLLPHLRPRYT